MQLTERWSAVDGYFSEKLHGTDTLMASILQRNREEGLPSIDVSPNQGKFLHLLVKLKGAKRILEIGTLGGYSSVWMARALPEDGELLSLEFSEKHAAVANDNIRLAGLENKVNILTGPALDTLPTLKDKGYDYFDFIFIDADKSNNPHYFQWAMKLSGPGTVIIVDNVVRKGNIVEEESEDPNITGTREMFDLLSEDTRIDSTGIQTVGSKGYDGLVFGIVK
ncbi:O-methyltransferase [Rossellomorea vietnamensis]|uniref:O-methyltransferase n=1 Tax=Rossellomorea vietnamensis TaxID=218284 RepID=A0A5D4NJK5_9BACI|nr:O-methyltransferase [Rossellomorea vietnamensis]TYS13526.1 O-methyltransferase [Rossellomorea vietnamensis]